MERYLKKVNVVINESDPAPLGPNEAPEDYEKLEVSGGGRVERYAAGDTYFTWLQARNTENPGFGVGYISTMSVSELDKIFRGTNISASDYKNMSNSYYEQSATATEKTQYAATQYLNVISPAISVQLDLAQQYINQQNWGGAGAALAEVDRLNAIHDANQAEAFAASTLASRTLTRLINTINSGRINPRDPYRIDDPTVASSREKERKRREQIDKELAKLAKEQEALKSEGAMRTLQMVLSLGFDIATAIAVLNLFSGPADEAALQAGKVSMQKVLEKLRQKSLLGIADDTAEAGLGQVTGRVADDAATYISRLMKGDLGSEAQQINRNLQRALDSGDEALVKKIMQQADDLISGKGRTWTPKPSTSKSSEPHYGTKGPVYQGAHRKSPGPYPYRVESHNSHKQVVLSESRKRILREIKKPYQLPEIPKEKYKMNFSGKYSPQNTPDKTSSELTDQLVASGNARGQKWRLKDKYWQGYETTEKLNIIYDRVGHGEQYWNMIVNENDKKTKLKNRKLQEQLNIAAHEKAMRKEVVNYESPFYDYFAEQETLTAPSDPLFKKVSKKLKQEIDYSDKPSPFGVPMEPPVQTINGYHPKYGKRGNYYNRLDPQSADAMPLTGEPEIDQKVKAAKKKPK